jgi:lipid-A-disaccharide synthase
MYYRVYKKLIKIASEQRPSLAILLDFPDFNLRLAKKLKRLGIKVIYYISPQVWAWRSGRVRTIRKHVDRMLVILPFEEDFYRRNGVEVDFVGHPLLEDFDPVFDRDNFLRSLNLSPEIKTIALLPGSRRKEIEYILPTLIEASKLLLEKMPVQFVISAAPTIELERIEGIMQGMISREAIDSYFRVSSRSSRDILANSDFAFVKSGTSSLEAALVGVPFLITYKISPLSWLIGSILIRSSMKGLVNLIATKQIVPELFQDEAKPEELARLALECLRDPEKSAAMRAQLAGIKEQLSSRCASESVAAVVSRYL